MLDLVRRSLQIAAAVAVAGVVFVRHRLAMRGDDATPRAAGIALVRLCTQLGATFIKVGQIASTRADLLPRPLVRGAGGAPGPGAGVSRRHRARR